jgi:hypothetical protein
MRDIELENKADTEDRAIEKLLDFDLAKESYQARLDKKKELRLLLNKNPLSYIELLDIFCLAVRSNSLELVKVLVKEKGITPTTNILHYALVKAELSAESSKSHRKYSIRILKYLMKKTLYMDAGLDSPQEELDLQEEQENFIQALGKPKYIYINNSIWNKDKQNIEFKGYPYWLEGQVIRNMQNCQKFIVDTDTLTLTLYEVVRNRLIALAYLEKYSEISKAEKTSELLSYLGDKCSSIQLTILQFSGFYISRKEYSRVLVNKILYREIKNANTLQALLGCKDENGQVILSGKAQNKEWCISLYTAMRHRKIDTVASLLDIKYNVREHNHSSTEDGQECIRRQVRTFIDEFIKNQSSLEETAPAEIPQVDKKEEVGAFLKPDFTPSASAKTKSRSILP